MNKLTCAALAVMLLPSAALAADAEHGRLIAQRECVACHAVGPKPRNEVADAPPFDVIGRTHAFDAGTLAFALLAPHPKMNFNPSQRDADDIAAYIASLPH